MKEISDICSHKHATMRPTNTMPTAAPSAARAPRLTVSEQLSADVRTMCAAGAMDSPEAEALAVRTLATLRRLTMRQAERVWVRVTMPASVRNS